MSHRRDRTPLAAFALATLLAVALAAGPVQAEPVKCQREIAKRTTELARKEAKLLQKCEDKVLSGKLAGPCPDAKTAEKIAKAESKLRQSVDKQCGGSDRSCGTGGDDDALASIGWDGGTCPNFEQGSCDGAIADCDDVADCVACVDHAAIGQAIDLYYDELAPTTDRDLLKCQRAIGKESTRFFDRRAKAFAKCEDDVLKGKSPGPCPDARADATAARAEVKLVDRICKSCGGGDRTCGVGGDDFTPAEIGFAASCPDVTVPGGTACGGPVADLTDLVECVRCVTAFKGSCIDALSVPGLKSYPPECAGAPPSPTPTATATLGVPTPTATPTPPPQVCGNDTIEGDEECDGTDDALCPGECQPNCQCPQPCTLPSPLPEILSLVGKDGVDLDSGWTGISHDSRGVTDGSLLALRVSNCDADLGSPTCGQCDTEGPILFPGQSKNCYCTNLAARDTSSLATCDPEAPSDCSAPETCQCFYGPPLPLSSGAVPVCVVNRATGPVSGTTNVADTGPNAGSGAAHIELEATVHTGIAVDMPCPTCEGDLTPGDGMRDGTCVGGAFDGEPCDVAGTSPFFGTMSFQCLPPTGGNIGTLAITFDEATTGTTTLATGPTCTAPGFGTQQCFCDTCATASAEPCNADADCPGGASCGAKRCIGGASNGVPCAVPSDCSGGFCGTVGTATAPNQCSNAVCSVNASDPDGSGEGQCATGPFDGNCSEERFRGCSNSNECNPPPAGSCTGCAPGQTCVFTARQCFLDPIVRTGTPGTDMGVVAATFCIPPTASGSVNSVAGLPGPGALRQPTRFFKSGALCGNGALDAGETCDPPFDGTCPGECLPDCTCANKVCGDGVVNQPSETCDGGDDAACPGACQGDCTCGVFCGDGAINQGSEECDGGDDAACPGACQPTCLCPVCGDDVVNQPSEACDGSDDAACPGACQGDCTCGPFCGDDVINQPGEECDGSATGACGGTCDVDCTCAPFCGDGMRDAGELCDGADDAACPGECQGDCTCPAIGELTFIAEPGADLDTGWTGTSHDFTIQAGSMISGVIGACDGVTDFECSFFANIGSACSADASISCTDSTQCPFPQSCVIRTYGPPLPLSSGGVPVCVVNRHAQDVTGTHHLTTGETVLSARLSALVHLGASVSQPCPICDCGDPDVQDCTIGESGTCSDNPLNACTVEGTGTFGPTSNDCPPNPGTNISGGGLDIPFNPLTTGTTTFPSNQPCDGAGFAGYDCWCDGQSQPSACALACDGGSNDAQACNADSDCPGAPAGACRPLCRQIVGEPVGEGECVAGPVDQTCAGASEVGCSETQPCPIGLGPCVTQVRRCFLDPIVREGAPGTSSIVSASTFCIPATSSPAVNNTAGLPGPGAIRYGNALDLKYCGDGTLNRTQEECDGDDDANCPGACAANCLCTTVCGNGTTEFGEQCDPGGPGGVPPPDDGACPTLCAAAGGPDECTCPALCGDGFVGPGEQCDPGGPGGMPPAADGACPGQCNAVTCQCPAPLCGNGIIEAGEVCELPDVDCGPLQLCVGCTTCLP